jgi:membrane protein implicated in regulation of membrane protease activity
MLLIGLGLVCIILELLLGVATGFDLFLIGLTLIAGGGVGIVSGSNTLALFISATLLFLYVVFGRQLIKNKLKIHTTPTNADALIGQTARVTKTITPSHPGQIKLDGELWRAESETTLEEGSIVVVKSISGVTLKVK